MMKNKMIVPVLFMIVILILATIPMGGIKLKIKNNFSLLVLIRSQIQKLLNAEVPFSTMQNLLHVPFFGLLAFLWMKFFRRRKVHFKRAIIFTLIITLFFSTFEEFCQFFIARNASFGDLFLNFVGCLGGISIYSYFKGQKHYLWSRI